MKKSLVLGAAALATLFMAAPQDSQAGEVKLGGYYMFRMQDTDNTPWNTTGNQDDARYWAQRVQLNMDFIQDKTTHAHLVTRFLDNSVVQTADARGFGLGGQVATAGTVDIRKAWLETDMWGVGVKVGTMPISLNDNILVSTNDDTGYSTLMLSKTFGDVTAVLADVRAVEGNTGDFQRDGATYGFSSAGTKTLGSNEDNVDVYVLSLFGKAEHVNYNVTGAYLQTGDQSAVQGLGGTAGTSMNDGWLALTLNTVLGGVDTTATGIYETGMSGVATANLVKGLANTTARTLNGSGGLGALRLKGPVEGLAHGAQWNAYGVWASKNFTNINNSEQGWSQTWDMGGPGAQDLMKFWSLAAGASPSENIRSVGVGLTIPANGWTVNPMLDYAHVNDDDTAGIGATNYRTTSVWGGGMQVSTKINPATTFAITGLLLDPNDTGGARGYSNKNGAFPAVPAAGAASIGTGTMHTIEASLKMTF